MTERLDTAKTTFREQVRSIDREELEADNRCSGLPRLLTVPELEEESGISRARIYSLIRQKLLPAVRFGRSIRISERAIIAWIEAGGTDLDEITPRFEATFRDR